MQDVIEQIKEVLAVYGLKIIAAVVIFIVGKWVAKFLRNLVSKMLTKKNVDPTLVAFASNFTFVLLMTFIILAAIGQLGVQTTSFIAVIGAAGLAVGLALQGSLANFAAGILMIIFRPFKVGDFIEAAGVAGLVEEIQIFTTVLKTPDNKKIIIPNGKITSDSITNYSTEKTRRVDLTIGVGYGDDIDKVKKTIEDVLSKDERILKDPAPTIAVSELGDSSVNFAVRPWVKTADYWPVKFDTTENIKKRFDAEGICIPFPQRDVHMYEHKE